MPLKQTTGSRAQVMHGTAKKTSGGLTKSQLKYNKQGKIVSKKASALAKKNNRLVKAGYVTRQGQFGVSMRGGGMFGPSCHDHTSNHICVGESNHKGNKCTWNNSDIDHPCRSERSKKRIGLRHGTFRLGETSKQIYYDINDPNLKINLKEKIINLFPTYYAYKGNDHNAHTNDFTKLPKKGVIDLFNIDGYRKHKKNIENYHKSDENLKKLAKERGIK